MSLVQYISHFCCDNIIREHLEASQFERRGVFHSSFSPTALCNSFLPPFYTAMHASAVLLSIFDATFLLILAEDFCHYTSTLLDVSFTTY
eukprot:scaffold57883_cov17-Tisochrysis_lutea.AAC.2